MFPGTVRCGIVCREIREFVWGFRSKCMATQEFLSLRLSQFHSAFQIGLLGSIQLSCILQLNGARPRLFS